MSFRIVTISAKLMIVILSQNKVILRTVDNFPVEEM